MNINTQLPAWAWWLMGLGLALFAALVALSVRRNRGVKRTLFAAPYSLWMILFTVLPVILIGYYAFTDQSGAFTLDNFRNFWDSNYTKNQLYASLGPEAAQFMVRGTVNVDTLVYSLWMAFLCTMICLVLGGGNTVMFGDLIESKFLTEGNWNVGSALSLIMMVLILISLSILRKADPKGEGGGIA